eukprot:1866549-Prymnesium_polylepis.1
MSDCLVDFEHLPQLAGGRPRWHRRVPKAAAEATGDRALGTHVNRVQEALSRLTPVLAVQAGLCLAKRSLIDQAAWSVRHAAPRETHFRDLLVCSGKPRQLHSPSFSHRVIKHVQQADGT